MTRSNPFRLVVKDPEIKRTTLKNLRARIRERAEMLGLYLKDVESKNFEIKPNIIQIAHIATNNFKIKPNIIQMVYYFMQFDGLMIRIQMPI